MITINDWRFYDDPAWGPATIHALTNVTVFNKIMAEGIENWLRKRDVSEALMYLLDNPAELKPEIKVEIWKSHEEARGFYGWN